MEHVFFPLGIIILRRIMHDIMCMCVYIVHIWKWNTVHNDHVLPGVLLPYMVVGLLVYTYLMFQYHIPSTGVLLVQVV